MKKDIIILFFIFLINLFIISDNLLLKNGKIFKGELLYLDKERLTLKIDEEFYDFKISSIEYLIIPSSQTNQRLLLIKKNDGIEISVNLIKLTETVLYYRFPNGNELLLTKLSDIKSVSILNSSISNFQNKKIFLEKEDFSEINQDITTILISIIKKKSNFSKEMEDEVINASKKDSIIIDNPDFYDKFWIRIYKYINKNTENLIWTLIENYSEKEKSINLFYNEKNNTNSKILIDEYQTKIIELRREFYKRARKIILSDVK